MTISTSNTLRGMSFFAGIYSQGIAIAVDRQAYMGHMPPVFLAIYGPDMSIYGPYMDTYSPYMAIHGPYMAIYGHIWPYMGHV